MESENMGHYSFFLFSKLMDVVFPKPDLEYDLRYEEVYGEYRKFIHSKYNDFFRGEYDCMIDYLQAVKDMEAQQERVSRYINSYKTLYKTLGSFDSFLKEDVPYVARGWINDNYDVGEYYKSHAFGRVAYDYGIIETIAFVEGMGKTPKEEYIQHIELMKEFYSLKGDTVKEIRKELKQIMEEVRKNIPVLNNQNKNKQL